MTRRQPFPFLLSTVTALTALSFLLHSAARAEDTKTPAALPAVLDKPAPESVADLKAIQEQLKKVLDKVIPCTVNIRDGGGQGSGVIVSEDGYVMTAGHVSQDNGRNVIVTMPDGKEYKAKTLGANHLIDSGFLKITDPAPTPNKKWPFAELGKSADLKKGQWVITTGHPGGYKKGRSPVVRLGRVLESNNEWIRTDCTIVGGDSGGPVFDMNGKVIGIHSRIGTFPPNRSLSQNVHVPVDTYRETWDRLVKGDVWGVGYVGFQADAKAKGCRVNEVYKGTPADKAGLKPDDVIVGFDGKKIDSFEEFGKQMRLANVGAVIPIEVKRGEETVTVKVTIGKRNRNDLPDVPADSPKEELTKNSSKVLSVFRDVEKKARLSTVKVLCDGKEASLGTIVGPDGWVLTKLSELKGHTTCKLSDGRDLEAEIVGVHELSDLALLKVDAKGLTAIEWQDSKVPPVGNWVATVGTGVDPLAVGVVSVGIRKGDPKQAKPVRDRSKSGYLGVGLADVEDKVTIGEVMPDTAAAKAGIKAKDIVLLLNGKSVKDRDDFIDQVGNHKPNEEITIKIKRGTEEKEFKVKLGVRPPSLDRGELQNTIGGPISARRAGFPSFLQHDTIVKPQDCGGPIVDLDGKVIGINIARAGRTETYTIPAEALQPLLFDLSSGKLAPKTVSVTTPLSAAEKVAAAKATLQKAEKQVADAKVALEKAEAELKKEKDKEKTSK